jgi:primosomal protein N' (replication factor Y)
MSSISRMDRDTMGARQSHRQVYEAMKEQDIQLLVGTQMVAKGLDFPEVTLVGVVSADTSLNLPDFRAGERTFDLLTLVAGRAGRGPRPGRVVLQTFCPTHYAIQAAQRHDYRRFFDEEIRMRRRLRLPPFAHLIELTLLSSARDSVEEGAGKLAERLRPLAARHRISLLGPVPDRVSRLRGTYRFCVALKGRSVAAMVGLLRGVLDPGRKFGGLPVLVDVDPL